MRGVRNIVFTILEIIIVLLLAIFAVENIRTERYNFIGNTFPGNVWWTVAGSALLGFLLAALMLGPGWVAAGWRSRRLNQQSAQTGQELAALRAEHARLQAEHDQTVSERDHYRSALGSSSVASPTTAAPMTTAASATAPTAPTMPTMPASAAPPPAPVVNRSAMPEEGYVVTNRQAQPPTNAMPVNEQPVNAQLGNEQQVQQDGGGHGILRRLHMGGDGATHHSPQDTGQAAPQDEARAPNTPVTPLV